MNRNDLIRIAFLAPVAVAGPVYAADYLSVPQAQRALFPAALEFRDHTVTLSARQKRDIRSLAGKRQRWNEQRAWEAWGAEGFLGWFLIDEVIGKHEFITYGTAISPEGEVIGVEIMSYRETHGGEVKDLAWREHFEGKSLEDPFKLDVDIPNIAGATLSCRNVTDGVKRLLALWKVALSHEPQS